MAERVGPQRHSPKSVSDDMVEYQYDAEPPVGEPGDNVEPPKWPGALQWNQ